MMIQKEGKKYIKHVRRLFNPENPFVVGDNYRRVAPVHVLNGFLSGSIGVSSVHEGLRRLIRRKAALGSLDEQNFPFLTRSRWLEEPAQLNNFRRDLRVVFDPDRKVFPTKGSPFPIREGFISRDVSDDGFGPLLWSALKAHSDALDEMLKELLRSPSTDPISTLGSILTEEGEVGDIRRVDKGGRAWYQREGTSGGSVAGRFLAARLARFLERLVEQPVEGPHRLVALQHLGRGLFLTSLLAIIFGPEAGRRRNGDIKGVDDLGSIVLWAGMPPGEPDDPFVNASSRSFQDAIGRIQAGLSYTLHAALEGQAVATTTPESEIAKDRLRGQFLDGGGERSSFDKLLEACREAEIRLSSSDTLDLDSCGRLVEFTYSSAFLTSAIRSMGNKIGLVGPSRGAGNPRFVCETPLLATLVAGLCPSGGIEFKEFVDLARRELGIVVGNGSRNALAEQLGYWEGAGMGYSQLARNQKLLKTRLVRSGLATEYSDGETEVRYEQQR